MSQISWDRGGIYVRRIIRVVAFSMIAFVMIYSVNLVLLNKYVYMRDESPLTGGRNAFYELEKDTVDVLLLGGSHMGSGINPMDLYETAHIRSWNLASDFQPLWLSYYWLKEALEYQTPQAVILDCFYLFVDEHYYEATSRKALDTMRWGRTKLEAVMAVCDMDPDQSPVSYLLTNVRFHTRWNELEEEDFLWKSSEADGRGEGFYKYTDICGDDTFVPIRSEDIAPAVPAEFDTTAAEYLDKITELCNSEGIALILIKTPTHYQTAEQHAAVQNYAEEHGLEFYDFNSEELYDEIGFDYSQDMNDSARTGVMNAHANIRGARKMSIWLAGKLQEEFQVESQEDEQWEDSLEVNEMIWNMFELQHEDSLSEYLMLLENDYDTAFITIKSEAGISLSEEEIITLNSLGFSYSFREGVAWFGVREGGAAAQEDAGYISCSGTIRDGLVSYSVLMEDASPGTGNITLGNEVYSQEESGIHIVVYSDDFLEVVDEVLFIYSEGEWMAKRE